jgi:ferritin-like metal-binding protein YciE
MKASALKKLYVDELQDLYSAERQLIKALPKMAKEVDSEELRAAFEKHLAQTQEHAARLQTILQDLGESVNGKKCKGMEALIEEGSEVVDEAEGPEELDAGLIAAAQRVEHYEIAGYGCVRTYAELLQDDRAASLLEQTLEEEKQTDKNLTGLAETINVEAAEADAEGEEEETEEETESESANSPRRAASPRKAGTSRARRRTGTR